MEYKPVAASNPSLQVSVSFGRFENDILSWGKFSAFSPNKYLEEGGNFATPSSVAERKAELEIVEEIVLMEEKPEDVVLIMNEKVETKVEEQVLSDDTIGNTKETETEKPSKLTKKDGNVVINRIRNSPKPDQVRTKPTTNKIATIKKTQPTKEIKNRMKPTKKPAVPISKPSSGFSTPRVYKPASKTTSLSASQSSVKKKTSCLY